MSGPEVLDLPGNEEPITMLWAFLSVDDQGREGICGAQIGDQHYPMITAEKNVLDMMRTTAKHLAARTGKPIRCVRFTQRETVETITSGMN